MKRIITRIIVGICGLILLAGGFVGIAAIAGGFGAHTFEQKLIGAAIGFGAALLAFYVAYAVSHRDTGEMMNNLITALLTGWW